GWARAAGRPGRAAAAGRAGPARRVEWGGRACRYAGGRHLTRRRTGMDRHRFVPRLDGMEDRLAPAVSPFEVNSALAYTAAVRNVLEHLIPHLADARRPEEITTLAVGLRGMAEGARDAAAVLDQFQSALADKMTTDPAR